MPITNNVTRMLAAKGIAFEAHELPAEKMGGLEAAAVLGVDPRRMFKTIVALPDGAKPVLALVPAGAQLGLKELRLVVGKRLQVSTQAQAEKLTGLQVGGISPLALVGKGFTVVMDATAMEYERIYVSGGERGLNVSLNPRDLQALTAAKVAPISET
jgi:Cys-tRNA(Pro)/Cys-tRNA(Cys) deacylase